MPFWARVKYLWANIQKRDSQWFECIMCKEISNQDVNSQPMIEHQELADTRSSPWEMGKPIKKEWAPESSSVRARGWLQGWPLHRWFTTWPWTRFQGVTGGGEGQVSGESQATPSDHLRGRPAFLAFLTLCHKKAPFSSAFTLAPSFGKSPWSESGSSWDSHRLSRSVWAQSLACFWTQNNPGHQERPGYGRC